MNNALPTNGFLTHIRIHTEVNCPKNCNEEENISHLICKCKKIVDVVHHLNEWGFCIPLFGNKEEMYKWLSKQNSFISTLICNAVYLSWKDRNNIVHGKKERSSIYIASEAVSYLGVLNTPKYIKTGRLSTNQQLLYENRWYSPPPNWIKVNVDATLYHSYKGGIGGVARNYKGRFIAAYGISKFHWDITSLEYQAIASVKEMLKNRMHGFQGIIIESDNMNVIKLIHKSFKKGGQVLDEVPSSFINILKKESIACTR
ncbi:uncharacterized protein LOC110115584 [Dendrobium catenatum]|uniref:uncharacterized protein LOC110115584 n=1 Tax=Dendrobium catenatum TaxID=906689 RepID=UPI0009F4193F|nr:uncharacterized protein LOC110115584 [Dendrobium catenatum]